jgi:hypothetical protein
MNAYHGRVTNLVHNTLTGTKETSLLQICNFKIHTDLASHLQSHDLKYFMHSEKSSATFCINSISLGTSTGTDLQKKIVPLPIWS